MIFKNKYCKANAGKNLDKKAKKQLFSQLSLLTHSNTPYNFIHIYKVEN